MSNDFKIVIPARYGASRLPGKPLRDVAGRPLVEWVWRCAARVNPEQLLVATDDERIRDVCRNFGAEVVMTDPAHPSGTDRLAEVAAIQRWPDDAVIVNLQGDEPLTPVANIECLVNACRQHPEAAIATLCEPLEAEDYSNPNAVKVVRDKRGFALYFSRASIPFARDGGVPCASRHIGLYAYRGGFLRRFTGMEVSPLEEIERLEQLRAMWHGERIFAVEAPEAMGPGIDTPDDLSRVTEILKAQS
ncbi:MAG: 3-deoxy-manno-octulosonate cytidylyltransferase [Granulosicoccaceae bacterium]